MGIRISRGECGNGEGQRTMNMTRDFLVNKAFEKSKGETPYASEAIKYLKKWADNILWLFMPVWSTITIVSILANNHYLGLVAASISTIAAISYSHVYRAKKHIENNYLVRRTK